MAASWNGSLIVSRNVVGVSGIAFGDLDLVGPGNAQEDDEGEDGEQEDRAGKHQPQGQPTVGAGLNEKVTERRPERARQDLSLIHI